MIQDISVYCKRADVCGRNWNLMYQFIILDSERGKISGEVEFLYNPEYDPEKFSVENFVAVIHSLFQVYSNRTELLHALLFVIREMESKCNVTIERQFHLVKNNILHLDQYKEEVLKLALLG